MSKRIIYCCVILLIIVGGDFAAANSTEWEFSPDSLKIPDKEFAYFYPGLPNIDINKNLSLPALTIYLETGSEIAESDFIVKSDDQIIIGTISPEMTVYDEQITSVDSNFHPPHQSRLATRSVVYNLQRIKTQSFGGYAVTILPVTIDENYNIVFNRIISLSDEFSITVTRDAHKLISESIAGLSSSKLTRVGKSGSVNGVPLGIEYVIITSPGLAEIFKELSALKNATGVLSAIALTDSIYVHYSGVDNAEKIRNYLIDFYQDGGVYVLLGGDDILVPVRYVYYYNTSAPPTDPYYLMPSDLYYADIDGEWEVDGDGIWGEPTDDSPDLIPDLIVGRLPVRTVAAVRQYIAKLKNYLTNPGNGDFDYLTKSFFFSSDQMRDYPVGGQHGVIAEEIPANFDIDTVLGVESPTGDDPSPTNAMGEICIGIISGGYGFIHILAHGRIDGFMVKSANYGDWPASLIVTAPQDYNHGSIVDLAKNNETSLYYSLSCNAGAYDLDSTDGISSDWSLVERLIASDSCGAIGMVANARWGWVYSSYHLQKAFTKYLYGSAEGNPVLAMYYSWIDYPYYRDLIYGQNYFGDPALKIYSSIPEVFDMEIIPRRGTYRINLHNNSEPIAGAIITLSLGGTVLECGSSDENGQYTIAAGLNYGDEYLITAVKDGWTLNQKAFTPSMVLSVEDEDNTRPRKFNLEQNFPNPFNPSTRIKYSLPTRSDITLNIVNVLGQTIKTISIVNQSPGYHTIIWDGTDDRNNRMPSGIYFLRLTAGDMQQSRKMIMIK